jgi:hypothetical protein
LTTAFGDAALGLVSDGAVIEFFKGGNLRIAAFGVFRNIGSAQDPIGSVMGGSRGNWPS